MIAHNPSLLCKQVEQYYYDIISNIDSELIPKGVIEHIKQCRHCHGQINRLRTELSQSDSTEQETGQAALAVATMLKLHFSYIGKRVTCKTVRPFLPCMLDPALEIRIPTPITAHLDNCPKCTEDLEAIRGLNIDSKQLRRLSRLLAEEPCRNAGKCSKSKRRKVVDSVALLDFKGVSAKALKHLCKCPVCRSSLYRERQKIRDALPRDVQHRGLPCESVSETDIFDYIMPYGLNPANDQYAKFREFLTSHLRSCPTCLDKMQQFHRSIYSIAERAESDVITIYSLNDKSAENAVIKKPDSLYADFPISVEVKSRGDVEDIGRPVPAVSFTDVLENTFSKANLRPFVKFGGIAAAAIILLSITLFFVTPPAAKAVKLEQVQKAIEKVQNFHVTRFAPDKAETVDEVWVSKKLNIRLSRSSTKLELLDMDNKVVKTRIFATNSVETNALSDNAISRINMMDSLGLSFYDVSLKPDGAQWQRIDEEGSQATDEIEIYELNRIDKAYGGSDVFRKCRIFVDSETKLPQRLEYYHKLHINQKYILRTVEIVEYLGDDEIKDEIKAALEELSF